MKNIVIGIILGVFISVAFTYATAIDIKKAGDSKFTLQDVIDTKPVFEPDFDGTIVAQVLDTTSKTFEVGYTYPLLAEDGEDYKIKTQMATSTYGLEGYNKCRNSGKDKAVCVKEIKTSIYEQSWATRQSALRGFESVKENIVKQDYLSELKIGDLQMGGIN